MEDMEIDGTEAQPYVLIETGNLPITVGNRPIYTNGRYISKSTPTPLKSTKTGVVYDRRMRYHANIHEEEHHPEDPSRISSIQSMFKAAGCLEKMIPINAREVTKDEVRLVHTDEHWDFVAKTSALSEAQLGKVADDYNSIYVNKETALSARLSCGGVIELCKAVARGDVTNGFANVRPPGHHAEINEPMGFCFFNNVAVAAQCLKRDLKIEKVFILDWDIHHGNGTQKAFYNDPNVVYCSIHRYDNANFYPGDPQAGHTHVGNGPAKGKTINIPWPRPGMHDSDYIYAFNKVVMPIAYEFDPDIVIVSAGFDAAEGDPIGENHVTPAAFGHMTHMLKSLAAGKLVLALEGGYNLDSISNSALACVKVLLGEHPAKLGPIKPSQECVETIYQVIRVQSRYWSCLKPIYIDSAEEKVPGKLVIDIMDMVKLFRTRYLFSKLKMVPAPLAPERLANRFTDLVCCSNDLHCKDVIIFFVHDMADYRADTCATSNLTNLATSYMSDSVYQYIETIINQSYGIVDVDVPPPTNDTQKTDLHDLKDLLIFLWDHFVDYANPKKVVIIGAGRGCRSLMHCINDRDTMIMRSTACVIMVPGNNDPVPTIAKKGDIVNWYFENSLVLLPENHPFWTKKGVKKDSGKCIPVKGLNNMSIHDKLHILRQDIIDYFLQRLTDFIPPRQ
ncbi:histone deacetylase clr3 [Gigaspora margarita]|uniref:histone deacetylase n=1 Tax=Gigaspora margarita TaxID=4874 RepID=A0A8H3XGF1_GIGMA|nr:histone deacetylase clr3 [Gigaspora margarita]